MDIWKTMWRAGALAAVLMVPGLGWSAPAGEVNLYTARHYDSDKALYADFTARTGIAVNVIEGRADQLIERLRAEGRNSPADVLITVDAGRLWRAREAGVFQPVASPTLERLVPAHLRDPEGYWFGISKRARVIVYHPQRVDPADLPTYEALAEPRWQGRLLIRSSSNVYNQSLVGSMLAAHNEAFTERWARGVVANMTRPPKGGDRDQIRAVAAGEADVAVANTYYLGQMLTGKRASDREAGQAVRVIFPNQDGRGTHVNISGAGVARYAPHREQAVRFLEFLLSPEAQAVFANGNLEYPVRSDVPVHPAVAAFGTFKEDTLNASVYGRNNEAALRLMDRAGWK